MTSLKVWLVTHNTPFPTGQEGQQIRDSVRRRLADWFGRVLRHRNARDGRPDGMRSRVDVRWSDLGSPGDVGDYDIVIYFSPRVLSPTDPPQSVERTVFLTAAQAMPEARLRNPLVAAINGAGIGRAGITRRGTVGGRQMPTLCEVFVTYDAQGRDQRTRVTRNTQSIAATALHEAAHNKVSDSSALHRDGGGGIFAAVYQGAQLNPRNIAYLAQGIWNRRPQYIRGQPLTPR